MDMATKNPYSFESISKSKEWNLCLNLLLDDSISEIETNGPGLFFYKKNGKRLHLDMIDDDSADRYMQGIKEGLVPFIHSPWPFQENSYLFEGPLRYEAGGKYIRGRCHIVLPPACDYPQVTIAKKSTALPELDKIAERGSMSTEMLLFVKRSVEADLTTVISGGTGAGKTTMLEAMTKLMPHSLRIGVAEDAPELYLEQPNVAYLHSVPWQPGMNPNDVATLSWVVAQYQRMRTDKLIIGETRGAEFADFLIAANSGMDGSLTTLHANDPIAALEKMSNFALKADNGSPLRSINTAIASSVDLVIQLIILPDGRHRMSQIQEITNTVARDEGASITTNTLYKYDIKTDTFAKITPMTDQLRKKFASKGVDIQPFLDSPVDVQFPGHGGPEELAKLIGASDTNPTLTTMLPNKGLPRVL